MLILRPPRQACQLQWSRICGQQTNCLIRTQFACNLSFELLANCQGTILVNRHIWLGGEGVSACLTFFPATFYGPPLHKPVNSSSAPGVACSLLWADCCRSFSSSLTDILRQSRLLMQHFNSRAVSTLKVDYFPLPRVSTFVSSFHPLCSASVLAAQILCCQRSSHHGRSAVQSRCDCCHSIGGEPMTGHNFVKHETNERTMGLCGCFCRNEL